MGVGATARERAAEFATRFGLRVPILQAPMSGACPPELAAAVAGAGGMGGAGMLLEDPEGIRRWVARFTSLSDGPYQLNLWIPDPPPEQHEATRRTEDARAFLAGFGSPGEPVGTDPDFAGQCQALLDAAPPVVSSIMGLYPEDYVRQLAERGIAWFACVTTLAEGLAAERAGADAVVAQGVEAGGHRGSFDPEQAETTTIGLLSLIPALADRLRIPVIATGGIADGRGVAAALTLGASAVQIGTALLRCPETGIEKEWSMALDGIAPEATVTTRAYSGRLGRAVSSDYVRAWNSPTAPPPAHYPAQRALLSQWRRSLSEDTAAPGLDRVNQWAGQSAAMASEEPADVIVARMWAEADALIPD